MFGYSLTLLLGRLFGIPLFVLGIVFLYNYWKIDQPKAMLRKSLKSGWFWLSIVLTWIAFGFELVYLANRTTVGS